MLVLSIRRNDSIIITTPAGELVEVVFVEYDISRQAVKLAFNADRSIVIDRKKLHAKKAANPR